MNKKYKKNLPKTTYKKQSLKMIWSIIILATVLVSKNIDSQASNEFINITKKIINYDLKLNDKRLIDMKSAITSFSISSPIKEYSIPVQGTLYKKYDETKTGIDIVAYKESVKAISDGEVISKEEKNNTTDLLIRHGELEALYGNIEKVNVEIGEKVLKDDILGSMGDISKKNKYFHFEIWKDKSRIDPLEYIKINNRTPISYQ